LCKKEDAHRKDSGKKCIPLSAAGPSHALNARTTEPIADPVKVETGGPLAGSKNIQA